MAPVSTTFRTGGAIVRILLRKVRAHTRGPKEIPKPKLLQSKGGSKGLPYEIHLDCCSCMNLKEESLGLNYGSLRADLRRDLLLLPAPRLAGWRGLVEGLWVGPQSRAQIGVSYTVADRHIKLSIEVHQRVLLGALLLGEFPRSFAGVLLTGRKGSCAGMTRPTTLARLGRHCIVVAPFPRLQPLCKPGHVILERNIFIKNTKWF